MKQEKLCKTCKHRSGLDCHRLVGDVYNPVTGLSVTTNKSIPCAMARSSFFSDDCAQEGKYWEEKVSWFTKLLRWLLPTHS